MNREGMKKRFVRTDSLEVFDPLLQFFLLCWCLWKIKEIIILAINILYSAIYSVHVLLLTLSPLTSSSECSTCYILLINPFPINPFPTDLLVRALVTVQFLVSPVSLLLVISPITRVFPFLSATLISFLQRHNNYR